MSSWRRSLRLTQVDNAQLRAALVDEPTRRGRAGCRTRGRPRERRRGSGRTAVVDALTAHSVRSAEPATVGASPALVRAPGSKRRARRARRHRTSPASPTSKPCVLSSRESSHAARSRSPTSATCSARAASTSFRSSTGSTPRASPGAGRRADPRRAPVESRWEAATTLGLGETAPDAVRLADSQREVEALGAHVASRQIALARASRSFALLASLTECRREEQHRLRPATRRPQVPGLVRDAEATIYNPLGALGSRGGTYRRPIAGDKCPVQGRSSVGCGGSGSLLRRLAVPVVLGAALGRFDLEHDALDRDHA